MLLTIKRFQDVDINRVFSLPDFTEYENFVKFSVA